MLSFSKECQKPYSVKVEGDVDQVKDFLLRWQTNLWPDWRDSKTGTSTVQGYIETVDKNEFCVFSLNAEVEHQAFLDTIVDLLKAEKLGEIDGVLLADNCPC